MVGRRTLFSRDRMWALGGMNGTGETRHIFGRELRDENSISYSICSLSVGIEIYHSVYMFQYGREVVRTITDFWSLTGANED